MPPAMTDHLDMWAAHSPLAGHALDQVTVDFLLPTGIYIQMDVPREATIQHIKLVSSGGLSVVVPSCCQWGKKPRLRHPHTITQPVRRYLMPVLTGGGCCGRVGVFCLGPPPALGSQTADDVICGCSECGPENTYLMRRLKEISSGLNFAINPPCSPTLPQTLIDCT